MGLWGSRKRASVPHRGSETRVTAQAAAHDEKDGASFTAAPRDTYWH